MRLNQKQLSFYKRPYLKPVRLILLSDTRFNSRNTNFSLLNPLYLPLPFLTRSDHFRRTYACRGTIKSPSFIFLRVR